MNILKFLNIILILCLTKNVFCQSEVELIQEGVQHLLDMMIDSDDEDSIPDHWLYSHTNSLTPITSSGRTPQVTAACAEAIVLAPGFDRHPERQERVLAAFDFIVEEADIRDSCYSLDAAWTPIYITNFLLSYLESGKVPVDRVNTLLGKIDLLNKGTLRCFNTQSPSFPGIPYTPNRNINGVRVQNGSFQTAPILLTLKRLQNANLMNSTDPATAEPIEVDQDLIDDTLLALNDQSFSSASGWDESQRIILDPFDPEITGVCASQGTIDPDSQSIVDRLAPDINVRAFAYEGQNYPKAAFLNPDGEMKNFARTFFKRATIPGAISRMPLCEAAINAWQENGNNVQSAINQFFNPVNYNELCAQLGTSGHTGIYDVAGYYIMFAHLYTSIAIEMEGTEEQRNLLVQKLIDLRDSETGRWNDVDTPFGESYGTAAAVLALLAPKTVSNRVLEHPFIRGDSNVDGTIELADSLHLLNAAFIGGEYVFYCRDASDVNDDGHIDVTDASHLLQYLFVNINVPPKAPFPEKGADPTEDILECNYYPTNL